jgi:hypothetical protein
MVRIPHWTALVVVVVLLSSARSALADDPPACSADASCTSCADGYGKSHCPPPAYYSPFRYWAPTLARVYDCLCGPTISVRAPDRHPEVPPTFSVLAYPCPPVLPELTLQKLPTPPDTSRIH